MFFVVTLSAQSPGDSIDYLRVTSNQGSGSGGTVAVLVEPASYSLGDTIPTVREVTKVRGSTAPLGISLVNIGQLGVSGSGTVIDVDQVNSIVVVKDASLTGDTGNVFGAILASGTAPSSGSVASIQADGDFNASIDAIHRVETMHVTSRIGPAHPGTPVTIHADNAVLYVRAGEFNAHIEAEDGADPFIQRIETTGATSLPGEFYGSVTANDLTFASTPSQPRGFEIVGDLNADLAFAMHIADPIDVGGDLNGDITIVQDLRAEIGGAADCDCVLDSN